MALMEEVTLPKPRGQEMLGPLRCFSPRPRTWVFIFHSLWAEGHQAGRALKAEWSYGGLGCIGHPEGHAVSPLPSLQTLHCSPGCWSSPVVWDLAPAVPLARNTLLSLLCLAVQNLTCSLLRTQPAGCLLQEAFPHLRSRTHHPSQASVHGVRGLGG